MPEHLKALVVILVLATAVFALAKAPITAIACTDADFKRRRNLWFVLTLAGFLAHDFWIFVLVMSCSLLIARRTEPNPIALYMGLFIALPPISESIAVAGTELFAIHHVRLLALFLLLPAYVSLRRRPGVEVFGRLTCDKLLLGYLTLEVLVTLPSRTFTSVLRDSVLYAFTDVFLPYYVASRSVRSLKAFRDTLAAFVVSALVLCSILFFEYWSHWLLYSPLEQALEVSWGWNNYLGRAGNLRAAGSVGHAIAAGYTCAVALGVYLYIRTLVPTALWRRLAMLVLVAGLVGALSRGPWVGALAVVVIFIVLGPAPGAALPKLGLATLAVLALLSFTKFGASIVDFLPWVGTVEARNVDFREMLAEAAFTVFLENPLFGRYDYLTHPLMEAMRGEDGLIDIVNTYIVVGLKTGGVGLAMFVGVFAFAGYGIVRALFRLSDKHDERHVLGRALLATLLGALFIIGTTSPTLIVPYVYWCLSGLAVGYASLLSRIDVQQRAGAATMHRSAPRPGAVKPSAAPSGATPWRSRHGPGRP